jgi:hypothetical protein
MTTTTRYPDLLSEVRAFRAQYPEVRYVDLICLDIPGHFYGKRYPIDMLEKVAAGSPLKLPQNRAASTPSATTASPTATRTRRAAWCRAP